MGSMEVHEELRSAQPKVWQFMFAFTDSMALKSSVGLRLADIMHSHGSPITLPQIDTSCLDIPYLARLMRMLVRKGIFAVHHSSNDSDETLYKMTHISKWLLHNSYLSVAPMILELWHYLSQCVKEHFASQNPQFNNLFNEAIECTANIVMKATVSHYKEGFDSIRSLVDVGGGTSGALAEIVKSYPHIKVINFDLPHVVATTPMCEGVIHVGGDMFDPIRNANAVFMKWILHDWNDEACVKILKSYRKAISDKNEKFVFVVIFVQEDDNNIFGDMGLVFDLLMFTHTTGGKEKTE
ncbi:hypothetical protein CUMW_248040 [Citrus unshiu]|uniref:Uncharacterized protein n=1 Tax=Citrus unshiu TaxID=55188 RepID=A0A2H5QP29_CITUN|nr:hypothetical protein CUMW_248040 [Citrus unshiu]